MSASDHASEAAESLLARARHRRVTLRGHFSAPVRIEAAEPLEDGLLSLRVRTDAGGLAETTLSTEDLEAALASAEEAASERTADPKDLFRFIEAHRIRLAYAHDPYFAVSLIGVRGCPTRSRLSTATCFRSPALASCSPMTRGPARRSWPGLLIKELNSAGSLDRVLILCPAP